MKGLNLLSAMNLLFLAGCCPKPTELQDAPSQDCPENIGQIQRWFLVRKGVVRFDLTDPTQNLPSLIAGAGNTPDAEAPWLALFTAPGDAKVVKTPFNTGGGDSTITPGTPITLGGGDNTFFSGATKTPALNPSDVQIRLDSLAGEVIAAIRSWGCENLEVFFINQENKIIGSREGDIFKGICLENVVLNSLNNGGFGTIDSNLLTAQLPYNWDETKYFITPTGWSPLTAA